MAALSKNLTAILHSKTNKDTKSRHSNFPFNARIKKNRHEGSNRMEKCVMKEMI